LRPAAKRRAKADDVAFGKPNFSALLRVAAAAVLFGTAALSVDRLMQKWTMWKLVSGKSHGGRCANLSDVCIYYETFGAGQPVLVLHGGLGSIPQMSSQIRALAASHFVIAVDSRGHGRSTDTNGPLSYTLMSQDMIALLDTLHIARVDVVGWSDGGIIGLDLAMRHPERVRRLVAISANFTVDGLISIPGSDEGESVTPSPQPSPSVSKGDALYRKVVQMWRTQPNYSLNDLARIEAPTLVMAGQFDLIKRSHTDQLAKSVPGAQEVIIGNATHNLVFEAPEEVNAHILRFLDEPR
jgi:pimeloyl-ACP methyl ester carboxylesterase